MNKYQSISERALGLEPSLTLEISALAQSLKKQGKDICSLSAGEPDYETPGFIIEAAVTALRKGETRYGPAGGDTELREAIATKLMEVNNIASKAENVLITNGGKQAIFNLFQVVLDPGDEVIIISPYWLSYPAMTRFAKAIPIFINTDPESGFRLDITQIEEKITDKTKLLIINSPCNPTGRVMSLSELEAIVEIMRRHKRLLAMSDEIYEFLISNKEKHYSLSSLAPDLQERIFTVNGFAKAWAMTGWRIGYLHGNSNIINKAIALQSQSTSNVCTFAQKGALEAIQKSPRGIEDMINSYNNRRRILIEGIKRIKGLTVQSQEGAFYSFPHLNKRIPNSLEFCKTALEEEGLAIIPGIAFGNDRCIRISCSTSEEIINEGLNRLEKVVNNLMIS